MQEGHGIKTCHRSKVDECVFYKGMVMYVLYTDTSISAGPDQNDIEQLIRQIQVANLNITMEGDIQDFLGINISWEHPSVITTTD
jgi:hypothetical protein